MLRMRNGTSESPFRLALGDSSLCPRKANSSSQHAPPTDLGDTKTSYMHAVQGLLNGVIRSFLLQSLAGGPRATHSQYIWGPDAYHVLRGASIRWGACSAPASLSRTRRVTRIGSPLPRQPTGPPQSAPPAV